MGKAKGSGAFAALVGLVFLAAFVASFFMDLSSISPKTLFQTWLVFAATMLIIWGAHRAATGEGDWSIGQPTIEFVIGIIGATVAFLALIKRP